MISKDLLTVAIYSITTLEYYKGKEKTYMAVQSQTSPKKRQVQLAYKEIGLVHKCTTSILGIFQKNFGFIKKSVVLVFLA